FGFVFRPLRKFCRRFREPGVLDLLQSLPAIGPRRVIRLQSQRSAQNLIANFLSYLQRDWMILILQHAAFDWLGQSVLAPGTCAELRRCDRRIGSPPAKRRVFSKLNIPCFTSLHPQPPSAFGE